MSTIKSISLNITEITSKMQWIPWSCFSFSITDFKIVTLLFIQSILLQ
jgi:hypothetical protein